MRVKAGLVPITLSDERDKCVVNEIFEQRCYEHLGSGFLFCPRQHWLDVGAHTGVFAFVALQHLPAHVGQPPQAHFSWRAVAHCTQGVLCRNSDRHARESTPRFASAP